MIGKSDSIGSKGSALDPVKSTQNSPCDRRQTITMESLGSRCRPGEAISDGNEDSIIGSAWTGLQ